MSCYITRKFRNLWKSFTNKPVVNKKSEKYNVGKSVAYIRFTPPLSELYNVTVTVLGCAEYWGGFGIYGNYSVDLLADKMNQKWIKADDGVYYNRSVIFSYKTEHSDYWVTVISNLDINK